ncbi:T9SS type A sorting domain-containing protein [Rosettibacter firmus]|uniref:T9SS type A sorting domain-containing protein n=1 Tax=Rosettibacter firmus TaxID=3111522 RepID=UPI00336BE912
MTFKNHFLILLTFCSIYYAQSIYRTDTLITLINGFEDKYGNSHIYYQINQKSFYQEVDTTFLTLYVYDTKNQLEQKLFNSYEVNYNISQNSFKKSIVDFYCLDDELQKYIVLYNLYTSTDTSVVLLNYDGQEYHIDNGSAYFMQLINDTIWINLNNKIYFSSDYGKNWDTINNASSGYYLLSISPFNTNITFYSKDGRLYKSSNRGNVVELVHDDDYWYDDVKMYYEKDKKHIYAITANYDHKDLLISDNYGEAGSWKAVKKFLTENSTMVIDDSIAGQIYYSTYDEIYFSTDFGLSFKLLTKLSEQINGLYKKPGTNILYCSTKNKIYEIKYDDNGVLSQKVLKVFYPGEVLKLYPLATGNKWIYHEVGWAADIYLHPINDFKTIEVISDTIINNIRFYKIKEREFIHYETIDSSNGKIYIAYFDGDNINYFNERNLNALPGDDFSRGMVREIADSVKYIFGKNRFDRKFYINSLDVIFQEYVDGIGLYREERSFDFGYTISVLKGFIIDGVLYGDTTKVDVKDEKEKIPKDYILYQNYPNPFNSETIITFSIPKHEHVILKIYDVLGREISTLFNKELEAGFHEFKFNAQNYYSGIYFYKIKAGNFSDTRKMILLK